VSAQDVELVRRGYEALVQGDFQTLLAMCEPDVQEGFAALLGPGMATWRLEEVRDEGDGEVLALVDTGDGPLAHVLTVREGRVVALREAGLA
jgi:ketosteroid isomerase-like protein